MFILYVELMSLNGLNCMLPAKPHGKSLQGKRQLTSWALDPGKRETTLEHASTENQAETRGILRQSACQVHGIL